MTTELNTLDFNEKLARLAVKYAINVQPGDDVSVEGSEVANDLIKAICIEVIKAGGHPFPMSAIKGLDVASLK